MQKYRLKGASGSVANQVFELRARTVIGSADDCDLRLEDAACAPHHCIIELRDANVPELCHIAEEPDYETCVNGQPTQRSVLARGDEVRIGVARWVVQAPGLRPQRVLIRESVRPRRSWVPWLLLAAAVAAAALAWQRGWIPI